MTFKPPRHFVIFLVVWVGIYFGLKLSEWPGGLFALYFIPIIYAIYHLIRSIIALFGKKRIDALLYFIIAILFGFIFNKLVYVYFNLFLSILIILFFIWIIVRRLKNSETGNSKKLKSIAMSLIILNALLIFIPYESIILHISLVKELKWHQLTYWDFEATPPQSDIGPDAETSCGIFYNVNRAFNYPNFIVFSQMAPEQSWIKKWKTKDSTSLKALLEHEQGHFDIVELVKRKICDSISDTWGRPEKDVDTVIKFWMAERNYIDRIYDDYTCHGADTIRQHECTNLIKKELSNENAPNLNNLLKPLLNIKEKELSLKLSAKNEYVNDLKEGPWLLYSDDNGHFTTDTNAPHYLLVTYAEGKINGISKGYYRSGALWAVIQFSDGMKDGTAIWYYENGNIKEEEPYIHGKENGIIKRYYENGKV